MEPNTFQSENTAQEEFSIVEIFFHYLRYWKWFIISIAVCLIAAFVYLRYTTPEYKVFSRIIISDSKKGQTQDMSSAFSDIGLSAPKMNIDNEIEILRSPTLIKSVVDSLGLGVSYFKSGKIKNIEIYMRTPIIVSIPYIKAPGSFTVDSVGENVLSIHSEKSGFDLKAEIGKETATPWGTLTFMPNPFRAESYPITVAVNPGYFPPVSVNPVSKTSSVVEVSIILPNPQKGQDIVNTLVDHYNKNAINDQNYVARSTISFIDERLKKVSGELDTAEQKVEVYNKTKGITDLQVQGQMALSSSSEYTKQITSAQIQLQLLKNIQNFIMSSENDDNAVPSNTGINDPTVISMISKYNDAIFMKKKATGGMLKDHPMLKEYNDQVARIRDDLLKGINISEAGMQATIREFQRQNNMYVSKASEMPTQARETRDLSRTQTVKETLYTYLLQKREDTGLALTMATPNAKVIDYATYGGAPVLPKRMTILMAALISGLIIPIIIVYIKDLFDTKIHTKDDVTKIITAPFLGVIPISKESDPFPVLKVRTSIAERFRTVISNLGFIVGNERRKIISVTSHTGGDGKSFFSRNLAMSLATSGKKTLLIDLDLRKSVMVKTLGLTDRETGSTMYLSDPRIEISDIIDTSHTFHKNLDIIPVHVFPPNPAELLSSERLNQLFENIGRDYNYIIIDTAPIGLVADVYNINPYASATIFLLRSDYTLKKNLAEIQEMYKDKKLNNLTVVLNAVSDVNIYGYGYGAYGNYKHNYYKDSDEK